MAIILPALFLSAIALLILTGLAWEGNRRSRSVLKLYQQRVIRLTHDQVQELRGYLTLTDRMLWLCPGLNGWILYETWWTIYNTSSRATTAAIAVSLAIFFYIEHHVSAIRLTQTVDIDACLRK